MSPRHAALLSLLIAPCALAALAGCERQQGEGNKTSPASPGQTMAERTSTETTQEVVTRSYPAPPQGSWFFRDLLATPPRPLPEPQASGPIHDRLKAWAGRGVLEAEPLIEQLSSSRADRVLAQLRAGLDHPDPDVRWVACAALGRRRDESVAGILMGALRDERQDISLLALEGITAQDRPWTMQRIIKCMGMHDNNPHLIVRVMAAVRLAENGNYSGIPLLIKVLEENTPVADEANREWDRRDRIAWEKETAIGAIGRIAGDNFGFRQDAPIPTQVEAISRIKAWWEHRKVALWRKTADWDDPDLVAMIERIIGALGAFQLRNIDNARYLLEHLGPPVGSRLVDAALGASFYIRFHALEVLVPLAEVSSRDRRTAWARQLVNLLDDPEGAVRQQAALTLGALGGKTMVADLAGALDDPDPGVQRAAAVALGRIGTAEARPALSARLAAADLASEVAVAITGALAATGERQTAEQFLDGFDSPDETVREGTRDTLVSLVGDDFGLGSPAVDDVGGGPDARRHAEARARALEALLEVSRR